MILICSGSNARKKKYFRNQTAVLTLPLPGVSLIFQFIDLKLRHYGDGYSNYYLCKILFKNVWIRFRRDSASVIYKITFMKIIFVKCKEKACEIEELLGDQSLCGNKVWVCRQLSVKEFLDYSDAIRDFYDLENENYFEVILWRRVKYNFLKHSRKQVQKIEILKKQTVGFLLPEFRPTNEEIIADELANSYLLGGQYVVANQIWKPDTPFSVPPSSLPSRGLIRNREGLVEYAGFSECLKLNGEFGFVATNRNYYHFLIENAPGMILFRQKDSSKRTWIIPDDIPNQIQEIMKVILTGNFLSMKRHQIASVQKLIHVRDFRYREQVNVNKYLEMNIFQERRNDIYIVRDTLICGFSNQSNHSVASEKVFLTRQTWQERTPLMLKKMEQDYSEKGYSIIDPGYLSVSQQIELFRKAKEIVALGGASLTNLMFCEPQTKIEVLSMTDNLTANFWKHFGEILNMEVKITTLVK